MNTAETKTTSLAMIMLTVMTFVIVPIALEYWVNKRRDANHWVSYYSIEPILPHKIDNQIQMQSTAKIHRAPVDVNHLDTLHCMDPDTGKLVHIDEARVTVRYVTPTILNVEGYPEVETEGFASDDGQWTLYFPQLKYMTPRKCQVTASPTVSPSPGVNLGLQIKSDLFWFPYDPANPPQEKGE